MNKNKKNRRKNLKKDYKIILLNYKNQKKKIKS